MEIVTALVVLCVFGVLLAITVPAVVRAERRGEPWPESDDLVGQMVVGKPYPPGGRPVECVCGRLVAAGGPDHHMVAESFRDDSKLAGGAVAGATAMIADFCPDDCPGGCQHGCPIRTKP